MSKYSDPNNYMSGVQTGTTPTLTPTTINSIEQAFIDLGAVTPGGRLNAQQTLNYQSGGFVPPLVEPSGMVKQEYVDYGYMDDSSSNDSDWAPTAAKRSRANGGEAPSYRDSVPGYDAVTSTTGRKLPGPRRSRNEQLPPEEDRKRQIRRQRNKMAAAKCRQRRVDLTNTLLTETDGLEEEKGNLENEIQSLQQQKEQLEFLLEAHKPICNVAKGRIDNTASRTSVKAEPSLQLKPFASLPRPSQLNGGSRPSTLPIQSKVTTPNVTTATGITISTPSGGIYATFGLDSMVDGHTGLTPITGAPSCSTQMHRNSSDSSPSDNLSPTTLMAL